MSKYKVGSQELIAAGKRVRDTKQEADGLLKQMDTIVNEMDAYWRGRGSKSFHTLNQSFDRDAKVLLAALSSIAEQLDASGHGYAQQEDNTNDKFSGVTARLNG